MRDALLLVSVTAARLLETARQADITTVPYYASVQGSNQYGIPTALVNASTSSGETGASTGMTYRFLVDRMCPVTGSSVGAHCVLDPNQEEKGSQAIDAFAPLQNGGTGAPTASSLGDAAVYRISIRVTEARGAQSFFQSTIVVYTVVFDLAKDRP